MSTNNIFVEITHNFNLDYYIIPKLVSCSQNSLYKMHTRSCKPSA